MSVFFPLCGERKSSLRILLTSDHHLDMVRLQHLSDWWVNNNQSADLIVAAGDLTNLQTSEQDLPQFVSNCEGEMTSVLSALERMLCRIVYVPGNHDPKTTLSFDNNHVPHLTPHSRNIHNSVYRLDDDLVICGLGGSVDACRQDGSPAWEGYPYEADSNYGRLLRKLLTPSTNHALEYVGRNCLAHPLPEHNVLTPSDKIIMLTHVGPYGSATTLDAHEAGLSPVESGSATQRQVISDYAGNMLVNIHGHTHYGAPTDEVDSVPVVNIGSLSFGHFTIMELARSQDGAWKVSSIQRHHLG
eukprot:GILJ01002013.1.p1 GENE.GILJ01002013.1~~GILJ01002013.1.p1  ORF type:complete len:301 (-),score=11.35 GILJ01002013.1:609-1511(-)